MSYRLVFSPVARKQLQQIRQQYPLPGLFRAIRKKLRRFRRHPHTERHPDVYGFPWVLVDYHEGAVNLYLMFIVRFLEDEQRIEVMAIEKLGIENGNAPAM